MAYRELELTLLSARDLKSVNMFTRMDVYAVASISGDPMTRQCTPTDTTGGRNPSWNATMRFSVPPSAASATASGGGWLHVLLRSQRALGDRDVGEVVIPLAELLAGADATGAQPPKLSSYQVHTVLRGEPRGVLNVSYRLGPVVAPVAEMIDDDDGGGSVYSAATTTTTVGYPAPQQPFIKPQNTVAAPHQQYQYLPQHDAYAPAPFKQPQNPAAAAAVAAQQAYYDSYHRCPDAYYEPQKSFSRPQTPQQQPYQYHHDAYSPAQSFKHQNPTTPPPQQQPYNKPQNPAAAPPQQQTYQYSPQYDGYYSPTQQQQPATKPQETPPPTPKQQPYQYPDTYLTRQQSTKPQQQTPASPPLQKPSHHPPPALQKPYYSALEEAAASALSSPAASGNGGYGPTNYFLGPHTQIILGGSAAAPTPTTPPPARSNSFPAKADDGPAKPKPASYTPVQPNNPSPAKADQSWPKPSPSPPPPPPQQQQQHQQHQNTTTPARPNASSPTKKPADTSTTPPKHHDTKTVEYAQPQTKLTKVASGRPDHSSSSWPKASSSPQPTQQGTPTWPNAASPKKPEGSTTTQPNQHDIRRVVEHVKTLTKVASGKHDHAPRPIEALEEQKSTQISVTKPDGTQVSVVTTTNGTAQVGGDYGRALSGKADSTMKLPRDGYYANTRSNSTPAKAENHQPGNKAIQQLERVHSLSTTAAR